MLTLRLIIRRILNNFVSIKIVKWVSRALTIWNWDMFQYTAARCMFEFPFDLDFKLTVRIWQILRNDRLLSAHFYPWISFVSTWVQTYIEVVMLRQRIVWSAVFIIVYLRKRRRISVLGRSWLWSYFDPMLLIFEHAAKGRLYGLSYTFQSGVYSFCIAKGSARLFYHRLIVLIAGFPANRFTIHTYGVLSNILIYLMLHSILS